MVDIDKLRDAFVKVMREKHDTPQGRKDTLNTLAMHVKRNILLEAEATGKEVPGKLHEIVKDRMFNELKTMFEEMEEGMGYNSTYQEYDKK